MIDRTLLTEAHLELVKPCEHGQMVFHQWGDGNKIHSCDGGTRLLLDFPTDEQVEAGAKAIMFQHWQRTEWSDRGEQEDYTNRARAALEAVRDTMIGETSDG